MKSYKNNNVHMWITLVNKINGFTAVAIKPFYLNNQKWLVKGRGILT